MNSLPTLAINFLLFWLTHTTEFVSPKEAHEVIVLRANEVITAHNEAIEKGTYFIPGYRFSDNQCVFSGMLSEGKQYETLKTNPG